MKRYLKSSAVQYLLAGVGLLLFWFAYYYFNSKIVSRSLLLAALDATQYMLGYLVISWWLLPRFVIHQRVGYFISGFLLLVICVGVMRIYEYKLVSDYYRQPYTVGVSSLVYVFITTTFILGAVGGVRFSIDWLKSQKRIEAINKERATAELEFLRGQLNPHFFFNSINTLYGSIDSGNEQARSILLKLSDMLRYQLYECASDLVLLEKELTYIQNFIDLQKLRSSDRIKIKLDVNVENGLRVTPLLLAPLVENAFKHASKSADRESWIHIGLIQQPDALHFEIENTVDAQQSQQPGGIGLANIQRRLQLIYEGRATLKIERKNNVFRVNLLLPL